MFVLATLGQKGGSGKSMLARLLAVELARTAKIAVLDADNGQRTLSEWNEARVLNGLKPALAIEVIDPEAEPDFRLNEMGTGDVDYVLIDAPGWSDRTTIELGERADLCVLPSACSSDDLRPTVRLVHELVAGGVRADRIVIVLNRVRSKAEARDAREFLDAAELGGVTVLGEELPDQISYRRGADSGQAPSEVSQGDTGDVARAVAKSIIAKVRSLAAQKAKQRPRRFVDKGTL